LKNTICVLFLAFLGLTGQFENICAEEYRILALRVDFPYEDPDHDTTSGCGVFDLRDYYSDPSVKEEYIHPWDIPPHNKRYIENHLEALKNYWQNVSEERVTISYEVWPEESNKTYTMSKKFYKYGNGRTKEQTYEKLVNLFKESVESCKNVEGNKIDFSNFDTFMIIHAGIGSETSGRINDIPSAFISNDDFYTYLGTSLSVDGININNGIVIPEMSSSTGTVGLNGLMAQMFGFRLGLPSFSNNEDGLPGVGGWCLMDTGSMAWGYKTLGFIPTHPCIWSKIELGWIEPVVVLSDTTLNIAATHIDSKFTRGIKIPINNDEYLLVENRYNYAPRESLPESITFSDSDTSGVWINVDHYDAYIPGKGLLIWHVNDRIIRENRANNTINDDPYRRGLDLLEADSRQDIGALFGFGDPRAEYSIGHEDDTYKLSGTSVLSPQTNPNSGSMWGGQSGITLTVNDDPSEIMSVSISFTGKMKGFPLFIGGQNNITAVDLNNDGVDELVTSGNDSTFVFSSDGSLIGNMPSAGHPSTFYNNKTGTLNLYSVIGSERFVNYMKDKNLEEYISELVEVDEGSLVFEGNTVTTETSAGETVLLHSARIIDTTGKTSSSRIVANFDIDKSRFLNVSLPDTAHVCSIAAASDFIAAMGTNNTLYLGYLSDETLIRHSIDSEKTSSPLIADLDRNNIYETVITTDYEILIFNGDGSFDKIFLPEKPVGFPVAADIDSDGYPEIVQCTEKHIFAFRSDSILAENFPFNLPPGDDSETITSPPVVVDLNHDGSLDIACTTSNMRLVSFDPSGQLTPGFPLAIIGDVKASPCIFKLSDWGDIGLAYITTDGCLMAHNLMTKVDDDEMYAWPMWKGGPELTSALINSKIHSDMTTSARFEAFCYPNPITGDTGTFRIIPSGLTDCTITVYTIDGRKVFEKYLGQNEIMPGVPNEVKINAMNLTSGLYIAKIETKQKTILYKLGVLK